MLDPINFKMCLSSICCYRFLYESTIALCMLSTHRHLELYFVAKYFVISSSTQFNPAPGLQRLQSWRLPCSCGYTFVISVLWWASLLQNTCCDLVGLGSSGYWILRAAHIMPAPASLVDQQLSWVSGFFIRWAFTHVCSLLPSSCPSHSTAPLPLLFSYYMMLYHVARL